MKRICKMLSLLTLMLVLFKPQLRVLAQNTTFTYQGIITDNGTNFTGLGYFEFALILTNGGRTNLWNNDGSSGSQPGLAVPLGVTNGLFTVVLGDPAVVNMTGINSSIFNQPGVQLQLWFGDGVHGVAMLNPPENLTPTPYATMAMSASNLVGALPAGALAGYSNPVNFTSSANSFYGSMIGNGIGLTNLNASALGAGTVPVAQLPVAAVGSSGVAKPDGTTIKASGGILTAVTLAAGAQITNATLDSATITNSVVSGNGSGITNVAGTNLVSLLLSWPGPTNAISTAPGLGNFYIYVASTPVSMTNVYGGLPGQETFASLEVSNSLSSSITCLWNSVSARAFGQVTTNALVIGPGKAGLYTIWIRPGATNYANILSQ